MIPEENGKIRIPMRPFPAVRQTRRDKWGPTKATQRYRDKKDEFRLHWGSRELPNKVRILFGFEMPKSWSIKKKEGLIWRPHTQRPDIDNLVKAILDSIYKEDSHIWDVHATKIWAGEGSFIQISNRDV